MSIELPKAIGWTNALIHKLETSKFEEVNLEKKPHETTMDKISRCLKTVRLGIMGIWGTRDDKTAFKAERACIDNYKSKLTALITHLSKTPLTNPKWAELVGKKAESATSPQDTDNERDARAVALPEKIKDFYDALKVRAEQVAGSETLDKQSVQHQAALIRAGLQEVADKINENNTAHSFVKKPKIAEWWNQIVSHEIFNYARFNLHKEISPGELLATGEKPEDYLNKKLSLYYAAIETNPSLQGFKNPETMEELQAHVMEELQQERGREFLLKINQLKSKENIQARIEKSEPGLTEQIKTKEQRFTKIEKIKLALQEEIEVRPEEIELESSKLENQINKITSDAELIGYIRDAIENSRRSNEIREILNPMTDGNDYISSVINNYVADLTGAKNEIVDALKESSDDTHLGTIADDINAYFKETQAENLLETDDRTQIIDRAILKAKTEDLPSLTEKIEKLEQAQKQTLATQKQKIKRSASLTTLIQQIEKNQKDAVSSLKNKTEEFEASQEKVVKLVGDKSELEKSSADDYLSLLAKAKDSSSLKAKVEKLEIQKEQNNKLLEANTAEIELLKEKSMQIDIEKNNVLALQGRTTEILNKLNSLQNLLVSKKYLNILNYEEVVRKQKLIERNTKDQEQLQKDLTQLTKQLGQVKIIVEEEIDGEIAFLEPFAKEALKQAKKVVKKEREAITSTKPFTIAPFSPS